jgi:hypothetical protein
MISQKIFYDFYSRLCKFKCYSKSFDSEWTIQQETSYWKSNYSAGGRKTDSFWTNPKFFIQLNQVDDNLKATLVIALMQKDTSTKKCMFYIQFQIYKVNILNKIIITLNLKFIKIK